MFSSKKVDEPLVQTKLEAQSSLEDRLKNRAINKAINLQSGFSPREIEEGESSDASYVGKYEPLDAELDIVAKNCESEYESFDPSKAIDFDAQLSNLKKRTEYQKKFTLTQVEDCMFIDKETFITMEFHHYQNECEYLKLKQVNEFEEKGVFYDVEGQPIKHKLSTEKFEEDQDERHPMSQFSRQRIKNYLESQYDVLKHQKYAKNNEFMKYNLQEQKTRKDQVFTKISDKVAAMMGLQGKNIFKDDEYTMIEGILALYKISKDGGLKRISEIDIKMGRKYQKPKNGNMMLTRSKDKKLISLVNFDLSDKNDKIFKVLAWSVKLVKYDLSDKLNDGINAYFKDLKHTIDKLVEVSFVGNNHFLMIVFFEQGKRPEQEMSEIKKILEDKQHNDAKFTAERVKEYQKEQRMRKAKKYLFFNVQTGEIVFEYGGIRDNTVQLQFQEANGTVRELKVYKLGLEIKEIRENNFNPEISLMFCGDYLNEEVKQDQAVYKWAMNDICIPLFELFEVESKQHQIDFIHSAFVQTMEQANKSKYGDFYLFDQNMITEQNLFWQCAINITSNRRFDQFLLMNLPQVQTEKCKYSLMVNGSRFLQEDRDNDPMYMPEIPCHNQLPPDTVYEITRNQLIKDELYYDSITLGEATTYCLRLESEDDGKRIKEIGIPVCKYIGKHDVFIRQYKLPGQHSEDVFMAININADDQYVVVQSRVPNLIISNKVETFKIRKRQTNQFSYQIADLPCMVSNLGETKLVIDNLIDPNENKKMILDLDQDEQFVCFVEFNSFQDIGFFPTNLDIECCSKFLFVTSPRMHSKDYGNANLNCLNLLLIDPYYETANVVLFKSISYIDTDLLNHGDRIVKACIQSSKKMQLDTCYKVYIWMQFPGLIKRSKLLKSNSNELGANEDSEELVGSCTHEEEDEEIIQMTGGHIQIDKIPLILGENDFIYYVKARNGLCMIYEGNPKEAYINSHEQVYSFQSNKCLAFNLDGENFYIMDDEHTIQCLKRKQNNRQLMLVQKFCIREIQRLEFKPESYEQVIIREKYSIYNSKIYFHYNKDMGPYPDGILESESLLNKDDSSLYLKGSIMIRGSNQYLNLYKDKTNQFAKFCVFQLPDQTEKPLINDFENLVDISTFLEDGNILLKCKHRFLIFDCNGLFLNQVTFNQRNIPKDMQNVPGMRYKAFVNDPDYQQMLKDQHKQDLLEQNKRLRVEDFSGLPFQLTSHDNHRVYPSEDMKLMQISYENILYLFYNSNVGKMLVYELRKINPRVKQNKFLQSTITPQAGHARPKFEFKFKNELVFDTSTRFQDLYKDKIDPVQHFIKNTHKVKIFPSGAVTMFDCTLKDKDENIYLIQGSIFKYLEGEPITNASNISTEIKFPQAAGKLQREIKNEIVRQLNIKINNIRLRYGRLPRKLHHFYEYETLQLELKKLQADLDTVKIDTKFFYGDMLTIFAGRFLKFAFIDEIGGNQYKFRERENGEIFADFDVILMDSDEIINVFETESDQHWLQIVVQDHQKNILKIITWNFNENMEVSMFQIIPDQSNDIGNHIIKGMDKKMNYFLDQYRIFDLQHNITVLQRDVNQKIQTNQKVYDRQNLQAYKITNQRKLYWDTTKFLGVERPSCLFTPNCRQDILLWKGIINLENDPQVVLKFCTIKDMNLNFNSVSLFHFYSGNSDIIDVFSKKYFLEQSQGHMSQETQYFPLQILSRDQNNESALEGTIKNQSPKSFESMIKMISEFPNIPASKMFLQLIPRLLSHDSDVVLDFFEVSKFCPPQMNLEQFVPWDDNMDELVFASHTSIIWQDLLLDQLEENGVEIMERVQNKSEKVDEQPKLTPYEKVLRIRGFKKNMLQFQFNQGNGEGEDSSQQQVLKRVSIEALDMDWIFQGNNAQEYLMLLATDANDRVLIKSSIKIFVELMWKYYQPKIIKFILCPYMVYVLAISILFSKIIGDQFDAFKSDLTIEENRKKLNRIQIISIALQLVALGPQTFFSQNELSALRESGFSYFNDPWNFVDINIAVLSQVVQTTYAICCYYQEELMSVKLMRNIGAFLCFFMWVKVFYWMRLFPSYSYYVKLIVQTIIDSMQFMVMNFIIMISFASFYYILNNNLIDSQSEDRYIPKITGSDMMDSLISIYLLGALGDFDVSLYQHGSDANYSLFMFVVATFIIQVVFMNMLIAIMGNTFSLVQEAAEESGLREQITIMADFIWILDLKKIFNRHRYIIRVFPSTTSGEVEDHVTEHVIEAETKIMSQVTKMEMAMIKQIEGIGFQAKYIDRNVNQTLQCIIKKIKNVEQSYREQNPPEVDCCAEQVPDMNIKQFKQTFVEILKAVYGQEIKFEDEDEDEGLDVVAPLSRKWMEVLDKNNSGSITIDEFHEGFQRIDVDVANSHITQIYEFINIDGSQFITINELMKAVKKIADVMKASNDDDDYGLETD